MDQGSLETLNDARDRLESWSAEKLHLACKVDKLEKQIERGGPKLVKPKLVAVSTERG